MESHHKLAIFDIDGTVKTKGAVPQEVRDGIAHLQSRGYVTTVASGRVFVRAKMAFEDAYTDVVSEDAYLIVEHGTKIVSRDGIVLKADYFRENEIQHVVDFLASNEEMIRYAWFAYPDPTERLQAWCKSEEVVLNLAPERGSYSDLFQCSFDELRSRLLVHSLSSITVKLEDFIKVENLKLHFTKSEVDCIFQDGTMSFVRNIGDKGKAIRFLEETYGVSIANMLIAGNAVNDVDMLNLPAGHRILVGAGAQSDGVLERIRDPKSVVRVATPAELGKYLSTI